jgi:hypothetical protein
MSNKTGRPGRDGSRHQARNATLMSGTSRSTPGERIDFKAVNQAALAVLPAVFARLLPGGRVIGTEFVASIPGASTTIWGPSRYALPVSVRGRGQTLPLAIVAGTSSA